MLRSILLCFTVTAAALPARAAPSAADPQLPMGLVSARLLPGWHDENGARVLALELVLEPGWKTYWRSPGDSGLPPSFDWQGSTNMGDVTFHWPAPEPIISGGATELGYHDSLILPFTVQPAIPDMPMTISGQFELGLCENICVPATLELTAPPAGDAPDARILAAQALQPQRLDRRPQCRILPIADGMRVEMTLEDTDATLAAIEVEDRHDLWISGAEVTQGRDGITVSAEMVGPDSRPFDLAPEALRLTAIGPDDAIETLGCQNQD
ncbi:MAG: protein-disulfide reductase DsbD family protein [Paracoccus sp. (in: a-proteobacteria)]|nr:protein-disulfide reductase DsbD family protein [Paracoccus sp. (in: a-proteobacteria)]